MSDIPINKWSFNQVVGKLHEAMHNNACPTEASPSGSSQSALNAAMNRLGSNCYNRPPCTHPRCQKLKTHPTKRCWVKEREERNKEKEKDKRHKAKKAKRKVIVSSSDSESGL